ncbi:RNA-binding (RRM/RBD/RNP motifs) family protein [Striga asiatica]|uniref:RNA-binding (RRM/RBD/RNP motifs) family protein n=1 Tax=Striga asiatica TaxID=4170 RepID=A0A5A7NWH3_STRAF|nr:RNA-binding (RRM/RBD/RNP motifs) family protein [Striga asiatica]
MSLVRRVFSSSIISEVGTRLLRQECPFSDCRDSSCFVVSSSLEWRSIVAPYSSALTVKSSSLKNWILPRASDLCISLQVLHRASRDDRALSECSPAEKPTHLSHSSAQTSPQQATDTNLPRLSI